MLLLVWLAILVVERASKQFDHVHTFHRTTSSVGLAGADGEFPVTRAATELMHGFRRKNPLRFPLLCGFFHFFVHREAKSQTDEVSFKSARISPLKELLKMIFFKELKYETWRF